MVSSNLIHFRMPFKTVGPASGHEAAKGFFVLQFTQGIGGNPAGRRAAPIKDTLGGLYGFPVQVPVPLADLTQGPIDRLFDKVPLIVAMGLDQWQQSDKAAIGL